MENASKALIIAGAILISILLISLGVMIMGSTDDVENEMRSSMTEQQIAAFNTKFLNYEGKQKASQVKALISTIANSNSANEATSADDEKFVEISFQNTGEAEIKTTDGARAAVKSTRSYNVQCTTGATGLVNKVIITEI